MADYASSLWGNFCDAAFLTGAAFAIYQSSQALLSLLKGFRTYFVPLGRAVNSDLVTRFGEWAVITGGTSPIGLAFAHQLASRGMNIVLISREYDDLMTSLQMIEDEYKVKTFGIYVDFFKGLQAFKEIEEALQKSGFEVGVLVNTNPIGYDYPEYLYQLEPSTLWRLINVNVMSTTMMTHLVLPAMVERRKGAVVNISSSLGTAPPTPLLGAYTASMAYVTNLSRVLHEENKHRGIIIQTLIPNIDGPWTQPYAERYAGHAVSTLGVNSYCTGHWLHSLVNLVQCTLPLKLFEVMFYWYNKRQRRHHLSQYAIDSSAVKWMVPDTIKTNNEHLPPVIILSDKDYSEDTRLK